VGCRSGLVWRLTGTQAEESCCSPLVPGLGKVAHFSWVICSGSTWTQRLALATLLSRVQQGHEKG
jgi:hypothetical protein